MREWEWAELRAEGQRMADAEAVGWCPMAGMTIERCWRIELCDCSMTAPHTCTACGVQVWSMREHNRAAHA